MGKCWFATRSGLFSLFTALIISCVSREPKVYKVMTLTRLPVARVPSRSLSLSLSAALRLLLTGADTEVDEGSTGCFRFWARGWSPLGVLVRVLGPLRMPRLSVSGAPPAPGKKSRKAEHRSGASLKSSSTFAKTSSCPRIVSVKKKRAARTNVVCAGFVTGKNLQELLVCVRIITEASFDSLDIVHCGTQSLAFVVVKRRDVNGTSG